MATKYFIYGVPGVGKSTIASQMAGKERLLYIELDNVRARAQKIVSRNEEPFVYEYSTEAWKKFGVLNKDNAVKGFLAVRQAFQKYIAEELNKYSVGYIAEAVYVDPNLVTKDNHAAITLIVAKNEALHYSHFFLHRDHSEEEDNQFKAARFVQDYLIKEADRLGINLAENDYKH
jgi:2-phosphoglycerate kinase